MSCTKFIQHPQPAAHYKRHPLSQLTGHKLYRGNLRARGISICLDIPATSTTAILDADRADKTLVPPDRTSFQEDTPGSPLHTAAFPQPTLTKTINWWMTLASCKSRYTHKERGDGAVPCCWTEGVLSHFVPAFVLWQLKDQGTVSKLFLCLTKCPS